MNESLSSTAPIDALLLDLDGTLTDSAPIILDAFAHTLTSLGKPVPPREELMKLVGPPLNEGFAQVAGLTGEDNARAISIYRQYYRKRMLDCPVYDGIVQMLTCLTDAGIPLGIATSKRQDYATVVLDHLDLSRFFTVIAGADRFDQASKKAAVIRNALTQFENLGIPTGRVVHVGDRRHDVEGAHECGLECLAVLWGYGSREELAEAEWHAESPSDLASLVSSWAGSSTQQPRPRSLASPWPGSDLPATQSLEGAQGQGTQARPTRPGLAHETGGVLASMPRWLVRGGLGSWLTLGIIIIVAIVFFAIAHIIPVFVGIFIALVITAILYPAVNALSRVMPRYPATFVSLLGAFAVVAGLVAYVVTSVTNQWSSLGRQFSSGVDTILAFIEHGPLPFHVSQQQVVATVQDLASKGQVYVERNATSVAGEVLSNAGTVVDVFVVLALAVFSAIFFLGSGPKMWRWFLNELPDEMRMRVHRAAGAGWFTFAGYARGTVILALTDAVMAGIFLQIVGVPLAAPLAVLVFIGAFIPMVGAPAAMIVAMIVALASKGVIAMIVVGLGVAGIGQIEGHILQPLIMGRQVSLHPVVVGIAVAVGSFAAGLLGAVVAVPLVSVLWSIYSELHVRDEPFEGDLPSYTTLRNT